MIDGGWCCLFCPGRIMGVWGRVVGGFLVLLLLVGCGADAAAPEGPALAIPEAGAPLPTRLATPTAGPVVPDTPVPAPPPAAPAGASVPTSAPANPAAPPGSAAGGGPDWTFSVVGDTWKDTPMLRHILQEAVTSGDLLLIDLGDLTPQGRPEQLAEFANVAANAGLSVYAVPGNHDVAWSHTTGPFEQYWPRHQSFDYHNAHFTLVDDSAITLTADELAWVDADLAATRQPLKFVFMHVPPLMPYPVPDEETLAAGGPQFLDLMAKHHVT